MKKISKIFCLTALCSFSFCDNLNNYLVPFVITDHNRSDKIISEFYELKKTYQNSLPPKLENFPYSEYEYPNCPNSVYIASDFTYACQFDFIILRETRLGNRRVFTPGLYFFSSVGNDVFNNPPYFSFLNVDYFPVYEFFKPLLKKRD